jgi:AcrR family transcriptional regulator
MARTRSARAHADVLDAAAHLFADRGIDGTSMDAIATTSGVSKATIYKHWPDKDALCLEVMLRVHGRDRDAVPPNIDSGNLRADLIAVLGHEPPKEYAVLRERLMPHLMAHSARNIAFGMTWRARVVEPLRTQLQHVLQHAIRRGDLPRNLNMEFAIALLFGPMMYCHVLKLLDRKPPAHMPELVVDAFLKSYGFDVVATGAGRAGRVRSGAGSPKR